MTHGYPRWFRLFFAVVMLAMCALFVTLLISQRQAAGQIGLLQESIELQEKRLAKQQAEYDQYLAELPLVQAELEKNAPLAQAEAARVTELKAQRTALREENAALAAELAALEQQAEAAKTALRADNEAFLQQLEEAVTHLNTALEAQQN